MIRDALLLAAMVSGSPFRPLPEQQADKQTDAVQVSAPSSAVRAAGGGVARLPFAQGHEFATLDEYLAHLERQSAIDLPWWREISPGLYEHVRHMPDAERETATRAELMARFGFSR
jgi:hypothetical protein